MAKSENGEISKKKAPFKYKLRQAGVTFRSLTTSQKASVIALLVLLIALPIAVILILNPKALLRPGASPETPETPEVPPGSFGQAISLDGTTSYLGISNSENLNPKFGFTIEAWVKPRISEIPGYRIYSKNSPNSNNFFSLFIRSVRHDPSLEVYTGVFSFSVKNSGNNCATHNIELQNDYTEEQMTSWHHVAGVIQDDGKMDIFVDGTRSTSNSNSISGICPSEFPVSVGARPQTGVADGYFDGLIDEARVSSISRYPGNFSPQMSPFVVDDDTTVLYSFNGDTQDVSSNGNNGNIVGDVVYVNSTIPVPATPSPSPGTCPDGLTDCLGNCVDINSDPIYCGSSCTDCTASGEVCVSGICQVSSTSTPTPVPTPTSTPNPNISCSYCFKGVCDGKCNINKDVSSLCPDCVSSSTSTPSPTQTPASSDCSNYCSKGVCDGKCTTKGKNAESQTLCPDCPGYTGSYATTTTTTQVQAEPVGILGTVEAALLGVGEFFVDLLGIE